jgi:uncharacterized membrane protein (Fun14 family)
MAGLSPGGNFHLPPLRRGARHRTESAQGALRRLVVAGLVACIAATHRVALAADASVVDRYWPLVLSLGGSFIAGFLLGRLARRTLKTAAIVGGIALLVIFVLGRFGVDGSAAEQWVGASSDWIGTNVEGASRYVASLLPSATAATIGGFLGFRRKGARRG